MTRSDELRALAQRVADGLPGGEVVLTGSVSRGIADELSDIEMLVVTADDLSLDDCFAYAAAVGLGDLDTWGDPATPTRRVSGYLDGVAIETVWWSRRLAEERIDALLRGELPSTADALVHGVALRTSGLLARWQERLRVVPDEVAAARIEGAAERWGGFTPAGLLTILRPGDRLQLAEWLVDAANRVLAIVYAINRVWQPTTKRLAQRVEALPVKPDRLAERIDEVFAEADSRRALRLLAELQLETVQLAPSGPYVDRAREWLAEALRLLQ